MIPSQFQGHDMGVEPKIGGLKTPKWMVKIMVPNPIKMDDLGGPPLFLETPILGVMSIWRSLLSLQSFGLYGKPTTLERKSLFKKGHV